MNAFNCQEIFFLSRRTQNYYISQALPNCERLFSWWKCDNLLFSCSAVYAMLPCPSPSPGVCPSSCLLNWWCHPTTSSSVALVSFCLNLSQHSVYKFLITYMIYKHILSFHGLSLHFPDGVLWNESFSLSIKFNLFFFLLCLVSLVSHIRNHCLIQGHEDLHLYFILRFLLFILRVLALIFRSLIHFELISVYGVRLRVQLHLSLHEDSHSLLFPREAS